MKRLSVLSMLILIVFFALVFALFARIRGEAYFYVTGPIIGAMLAAFTYRRDRSAMITGGVIGGLCQGIFAVMVMKRGYIFPDRAMITGGLFLANLAVHVLVGLVIGAFFYLAFRRARPRSLVSNP